MRRTSRRSSRPAHAKDWYGATAQIASTAGPVGTAAWLFTPQFCMQFDNPTLIASRQIFNYHNASLVGSGGSVFAAGVIVFAGDPDVATVPNEFPEPTTDSEVDWLVRFPYVAPQGQPAAFTLNTVTESWAESRGKRKIPRGSGLLFVAAWDLNTISLGLDYRALIMSG